MAPASARLTVAVSARVPYEVRPATEILTAMYLSTERVWLKCTDEIRALDGKEITVVEDGHYFPMHLRVSPGETDEKCSVVVWQATGQQIPVWRNVASSPTPPPTAQIGLFERFLTVEALALIRRKDQAADEPLLLVVPTESESPAS